MIENPVKSPIVPSILPSLIKLLKTELPSLLIFSQLFGGTMGLLTGFSIISGVEIFYFAAKMFVNLFNKKFSK